MTMMRSALVFATTSAVLVISIFILVLARAPHVPSTIREEEYGLYADWTKSHFSQNPPQGQLYVLNRTFKFNPLEQPGGCSLAMIEKAGVSKSLPRQLSNLGDAEYIFASNLPVRLRIPWKYTFVEASPDQLPGTFHLLAFSRIAFSRNHREALFAASDACAAGDCGRGGVVYAQMKQGTWTFKSVCSWMY
jgi:hypothetical protein